MISPHTHKTWEGSFMYWAIQMQHTYHLPIQRHLLLAVRIFSPACALFGDVPSLPLRLSVTTTSLWPSERRQ